ncbi:MAG: hypothetical protein HY549_00070 [Elusimicrobia bacterium]|nr:hypothetical protein [Elusimicrobiota bacterium]
MRFLEDGNMIGRIGALAVLIAAGLWMGKISYGWRLCPFCPSQGSHCSTPPAP